MVGPALPGGAPPLPQVEQQAGWIGLAAISAAAGRAIPSVLDFGNPGEGLVLRPGMIFTIEPMVNAGTWQVKLKKDGWTVITRDRQLSAQVLPTATIAGHWAD